MKNLLSKGSFKALLGIILTYIVLFVLLKTGIINSYYGGILNLILINLILAISLNLIVGFTGQLCLGHAGFMAIGAYTSAILSVKLSLPFFISILIGSLVASLFAFLIGIPTLKLTGDYFAITTLAFGEIIRVIIMNINYLGGASGLSGIPIKTKFTTAYIFAVITIVVIYNLLHSSHGRAMISVRENEIASEAMGVNTFKYKMHSFCIAAFFAGLAGGLFSHHLGFIQPASFDFIKSIDILTFVVFGGMGSLSGSVIATMFLTFLPEGLRSLKELRMIIYPLALIILMLFRPQGLLGNKELSINVFKNFNKQGLNKRKEEEKC